MELYIAGGVGEHGRNCFFVTFENLSFIVDCGIMAGDEKPFPRLDDDMIRSAEYLFLTHSHADHCGALEWLYSKGFSGTVIASAPTFSQMKFEPIKKICLEEAFSNRSGCLNGLNILWGRSGHCIGSVWYRFEQNGRPIFFFRGIIPKIPSFINAIKFGISAQTRRSSTALTAITERTIPSIAKH